MKNLEKEIEKRVEFICELLKSSKSNGIVFGNSGGKDSVLVGILCKMACDNTKGVIMPCGSTRNFNEDTKDALEVAKQFSIETKNVDLSRIKDMLVASLGECTSLTDASAANIAPRLRMTTLYAIAASENLLVAGTGNKSELHMGYFTKWGDGAYDFNPIADLTVTEIYEFLRFLKVPAQIIEKAPSGGLFDGQTDEEEMGITYDKIDDYILNGIATQKDKELIDRFHQKSKHKRCAPIQYNDE